LADGICGRFGIPLLVLHDFDRPGIIIKDTLENDTRRYVYKHAPVVIDLGLRYEDVGGLDPEPHSSSISDERLRQAGLGEDAINFLRSERVELNAMTSRQLVDFVEAKLKEARVGKVIPDAKTLAQTYQMFVASDRLAEAFEETKENLEREAEASISVPADLQRKVRSKLREQPDIPWHRAVRLIVDPDAADDEGDDADDGDDLEDEDLSDIDE